MGEAAGGEAAQETGAGKSWAVVRALPPVYERCGKRA